MTDVIEFLTAMVYSTDGFASVVLYAAPKTGFVGRLFSYVGRGRVVLDTGERTGCEK